MIYVVNMKDNMILNRCDAWEADGYERMLAWCAENGWNVVGGDITSMGDMVIGVVK